MNIEEKRRAAFEVWARKKGLDLAYRNFPGIGQFYECPRTLLAQESWSAALDSVVIELPADNYYEDAASVALDDCREAIESAGLKAKP